MNHSTRRARAALRTLRVATTLAVLVGAGFGTLAAREALAARKADAPAPVAAPLTATEIGRIEIEETYAVARRFAGEFEPWQTTALGFELGGTIEAVLVAEGDAVTKGQSLARLDTRLLQAERDRLVAARAGLKAQAELARRTDARQAVLRARGFASEQALDDTSLALSRLESAIAEAEAGIAATDVRLAKAELAAPFAGRIGDRLMDAGAVAAPGATALTLLEDGPSLFEVGLDPALAARVTQATRIVVETDYGPMSARLVRLAPQLDPATRTRTAFLLVEGGEAPPAGTTGEVVLTEDLAGRGAWVPLSALRPGPGGSWQILTVTDDDPPRIGVEAAEIVHAAGARAFVRGSFADGASYLPDGTHRVVPGEPVRLVDAAQVAAVR